MANVYYVLRSLTRQQSDTYSAIIRLSTASVSLQHRHNITLNKNIRPAIRTCHYIPSRCFSSNTSPNNTEPLIQKDDPKTVDIGGGTWEEVYRGIMTTQLKMVKAFSLSTSVIGICAQPILAQEINGATGSLGLVVAVGAFVGFFTFITPALIHWVSRSYVISLKYDPAQDIYCATTVSFFLREKKVNFNVKDVEVPIIPGMFTTFIVNKKPFFVDHSYFSIPIHYGRLMQYDAIDIDLNKNDKKSETD